MCRSFFLWCFYPSRSPGSAPISLATYLWFSLFWTPWSPNDYWRSVRENLTRVYKTTRWITNVEICQAVPLNYKFSPQSLVREHILLSPGVHCLFSVSSTSDSAVLGNAISPGHFFKRFYHETEVSVVFLRSWEEDTRSHIDRKNKSGRSCLQPPPSRFSKH